LQSTVALDLQTFPYGDSFALSLQLAQSVAT